MDFSFGDQVVSIPEPENCPDCRAQLRTMHRNESHLYQRKSTKSGKQLISIYNPDCDWNIVNKEEWHTDQWDALDYGRDFDFNRPFFEQFLSLSRAVPRMALITVANENCPYTTGTAYSKNCHLINSSEYCEDCYYGKLLQKCRDTIDSSYCYDSERCYECFSVRNCFNCVHVYYSQNSSDCWFSENLKNCRNCFLCTDLDGKEYYFMNQPLSKEEFEKRVSEFKGSHQNFERAKQILKDLRKKTNS
ncbi:hypothetical protein IPJ72_05730 [Candidatus Peregrinibacteria bacterium]|nr:MAG: hypothetical protein IPJ72_05730 [Candidatus Peregrinibacteria bacterium]